MFRISLNLFLKDPKPIFHCATEIMNSLDKFTSSMNVWWLTSNESQRQFKVKWLIQSLSLTQRGVNVHMMLKFFPSAPVGVNCCFLFEVKVDLFCNSCTICKPRISADPAESSRLILSLLLMKNIGQRLQFWKHPSHWEMHHIQPWDFCWSCTSPLPDTIH